MEPIKKQPCPHKRTELEILRYHLFSRVLPVHSAGCYHTPVFNADIRSGYSACRAFALPSAAHYAVPLSTWFSATHALCVCAYDFTSASSVWLMKLCLHYSLNHLNVKTVSVENLNVRIINTKGLYILYSPYKHYANKISRKASFSTSDNNAA